MHEKVPLEPVIAGLTRVLVVGVPDTATGWFTYSPVVAVHENVPPVLVTATLASLLVPSDPVGVTV